ncbi:hypothetical protein CDL15_Pgr009415 [Punica granatum]|uniref:CLAVATA3/ESR (CLE)-related protein 27 n=1 Tax=Punica granatum TaxID=22663 RepID=A0A218WU77_PUNGR|nr:hypothetical protein CDL15_Pgr009415 [Punica granatum]PKI60460.1 hypothetical protein CRG98_019114 [Punica granatum]
MSFPSIRARRTRSLVALLLILSLLHICTCRASASRLFPAASTGRDIASTPTAMPPVMVPKKNRDELLQKYFPGTAPRPDSSSPVTDRGGGGFGESKRKVPSCPDPLHN